MDGLDGAIVVLVAGAIYIFHMAANWSISHLGSVLNLALLSDEFFPPRGSPSSLLACNPCSELRRASGGV